MQRQSDCPVDALRRTGTAHSDRSLPTHLLTATWRAHSCKASKLVRARPVSRNRTHSSGSPSTLRRHTRQNAPNPSTDDPSCAQQTRLPATQARIEYVAQRVAHQVEAEHG